VGQARHCTRELCVDAAVRAADLGFSPTLMAALADGYAELASAAEFIADD
jgi:hypothetical protein